MIGSVSLVYLYVLIPAILISGLAYYFLVKKFSKIVSLLIAILVFIIILLLLPTLLIGVAFSI